jgi:translation elongation factor EF-1alpha
MIIKCQSKIYPGSLFDLHIHTAVAEVRLKQLTSLIDPETHEEILEYPKFIKQDQVAIAIFELSQSGQIICMELFKDFPELGRFALCDEGQTVAVGKILEIMG